MNEISFYTIRLILIFVFNAGFAIFYISLYKDIFGIFVFCLILINIFVVISYLRYYYDIEFRNNSILYKNLYSQINFDFNDILWVKKRLLDNMLILGLSNGRKIKVCFLRKDYLIEFFRKLKSMRSDLFIAKIQEFPKRYYVSSIYLVTLLFRILISLFIYYVSFNNIIIFLFIFFIDIKVLIGDILVIKNLVIFYEFRETSIYERKIFSRKEYFYKFFKNVFLNSTELEKNDYLSFIYDDNRCRNQLNRVFIGDNKMSYSMQRDFAYIYKYCNKVT
ncbi:hypothetical protein DB313_01195 [Borrelia turcica IST7]|uniref:Membrane associated protein n=1 Tax=Borrelia turcica IST7 TaxID=1104446 RepID=A0A386PK37_9SPIR|nr:hypothetical protein [Borrelia turcica]AYE36121.1 hypothetical protein DB313_01195 [Borrelia turcica IST7]